MTILRQQKQNILQNYIPIFYIPFLFILFIILIPIFPDYIFHLVFFFYSVIGVSWLLWNPQKLPLKFPATTLLTKLEEIYLSHDPLTTKYAKYYDLLKNHTSKFEIDKTMFILNTYYDTYSKNGLLKIISLAGAIIAQILLATYSAGTIKIFATIFSYSVMLGMLVIYLFLISGVAQKIKYRNIFDDYIKIISFILKD